MKAKDLIGKFNWLAEGSHKNFKIKKTDIVLTKEQGRPVVFLSHDLFFFSVVEGYSSNEDELESLCNELELIISQLGFWYYVGIVLASFKKEKVS